MFFAIGFDCTNRILDDKPIMLWFVCVTGKSRKPWCSCNVDGVCVTFHCRRWDLNAGKMCTSELVTLTVNFVDQMQWGLIVLPLFAFMSIFGEISTPF